MKKKLWILSLVLLIFLTYFVVAEETTVDERGYDCLETMVAENCQSLSAEERIFSLLAIDRCKTEVLEDQASEGCWPDTGCSVKMTAQAILALYSVGADTTDAEEWLLSKETTPASMEWLLQIESTKETSCDITYLGDTHIITLDEDKKIDGSPGSCFDIHKDYWLKVDDACYNEEFTISCDETFLTNLLYYKISEPNLTYVSKLTTSASAEGSTTAKVNSYCFIEGGACNYEGTLWAAQVLKLKGYDISGYLPYLVTMADEYSEFLPESFLYSLTGSFKEELLLKQQESKWWYESGDKIYDTAVALYALQQDTSTEKTGAKAWLEEIQGDDGCWQSNIRNTAFILFSAWPKKIISGEEQKPDCEEAGYYCLTSSACTGADGTALTTYGGCFGTNVCCDSESLLSSCLVQGGEICASGELCNGETIEAADTSKCCVDGECEVVVGEEESECEVYGGTCKSLCSSSEESRAYDCPSYDECCFSKSKKGYAWIIILGALIVLTALGIVFRKKLRKLWLKLKSKFKKGKSPPRRPPTGPRRFPPGPSSSIPRRGVPRRMLPPNQRQSVKYSAPQKQKGELDEVLKKLKDMGK